MSQTPLQPVTVLGGPALAESLSPAPPSFVGGQSAELTPLPTPPVCCRILSLACSPSGASFVCSAAASSLTAHVDVLAPDIGSRGTNQVPGRLLLWDTKTMKQQVGVSHGALGLGTLPGWGAHRVRCPLFLWSLPSLLWAPHILICEISEHVET